MQCQCARGGWEIRPQGLSGHSPGTELLLWKEQEQEAPLEKEVMQLKVCENSSTPNRQQEAALEAITLDHLSGCAGEFIHNICTV